MSASNIAQFITFGSLIGRTFGFCMILLRIVFDCVGFRECVNVACLGDVLCCCWLFPDVGFVDLVLGFIYPFARYRNFRVYVR